MLILDKLKQEIIKYNIKNDIIKFKNKDDQILKIII